MSLLAEQEIISCILRKNSLMQNCDLTPNQFEHEAIGEIFSVISQLVNSNKTADVVTVMEELKGMPRDYLSTFIELEKNANARFSGFNAYVAMVEKGFKKRTALNIAHSLQYSLSEDGDLEVIDQAISDLMSIDTSKRNYSHTIDESVTAALEIIETAFESDGLVGISSGLQEVDNALGGFHDTDLIVLGARPAMGKTALLLNFANSCKVSCGIISAEQGHAQAALRMISMNGSVDSQKMRTGSLIEEDWVKLTAGVSQIKGRPIYINDQPGISITKLIKQAREWKFKYDIKILYVDYIQKIRGSDTRRNKTEQVTEVTGALKDLARELNIPVVALAQVKREVESRNDKRPGMGDMSDASEIEKEADVIGTIYRDEVYNPDTQYKGIAEIDWCKNRHGPIGVVNTQFIGQYMQFNNLSSYQGNYQ